MDFRLTEEQKMLQQTIREFAESEIKPLAAESDHSGKFPIETIKKLAELGFMGIPFPEKYGGAGLDYLSYAIAVEEISTACASTGVIVSAHTSLCCDPIYSAGTEEQKQKFLTPLAKGVKIGCLGLTEPSAGSDAANIKTSAVADGNNWIINGSKLFITNGAQADIAVITAFTDKNQGHKGISTFIVEKGTPGFKVGKVEEKLGIKASSTSELIFEDCRIPKENLLGPLGNGFKIALQTLDGGRIGIAAQAVGIARAALEASVKYSKERTQFNQPISNFQAIQWMLADMATQIDAARLLTMRAASLKDAKERFSQQSAMAKLFASEAATYAAHKAIQIYGGYGYTKDYPVERFYRDARITEIYEGTSEIQRLVIASNLLR
ncbi:MAG TPA: acyl-CoA dehydrogenase [Planctomycetota bacterium]|nr:acyl-CoA dehydrogenase [Planctomycetota bacterium]